MARRLQRLPCACFLGSSSRWLAVSMPKRCEEAEVHGHSRVPALGLQSAVGPQLELAVNPATRGGCQRPQLLGQQEEQVHGTWTLGIMG